MTMKRPSETVVQNGVFRQAEAILRSQTHSTTPTGQENLLEEADLIEDETAPPAYGEIYGEIRNEKSGFGAQFTGDGRVDIRINQLNRRLSQIFIPALRQHSQNVEESSPTPLPYVPSSLGVKNGEFLPPSLNVVIQVVGSRGDVQPFVALGKVLKETYGHRVRLATHPTFKDFVEENGLEFFSIGGDPSLLMAFMVKNPGLMPRLRSIVQGDVSQRRRDVSEYIQGCWRSCYKAGDGMNLGHIEDDPSEPAARRFVADCIIANPPSFAHIHCAEKLGIPLHIMFTMPYSPTQAFPHPLANIQSSNADPRLTNYISYAMIEVLVWQGLGDIINRFREKCLGLDPVSLIWAPGMLSRLRIPHTYCWSPALIPKPKDWASQISISGFCLLNLASSYTPSPELQAFLDAGPPPVYIGFGSIVLDDPNALTDLIFDAVKETGQRVLLSKGWGGMGANELSIPSNIFMLGNVPHDWLFKHVSCVVHHGGAGTTAAGITAGRPTLIVPFFGDQPFWGAMVARSGAGPVPIPFKQLTADKLAAAINFCLKPESLGRAQELESKISAEKGSEKAAQSFHRYLEVDRLRCTLIPSRPATWRIKRTQVRLSALAACTLANSDLMDFHDLELFRAQEHYPDEGPTDPVSGFAAATFGAITTMAMGVVDTPAETFKAFLMPFTSIRKHSKSSQPTVAKKGETRNDGERSTPAASPEQSQTSLNRQESLDSIRTPPSLSTRIESSAGKDHDMLRETGPPHTSKGIGRILKTALKSPVDLSMSITSGFHNAPKLWGDDTVRPPQKVSDLKSGAKAVRKEFAFGMYDGLTGIVTQPWKGAQKEGPSGFLKGVGKGIGGMVVKPGAALFGIPSYIMKGVQKEVQNLFGSNVQNYIIASRVAQGYEEWLQASDEEKEDIIACWQLIRKYSKKKGNSDEMRDILEAHRKMNTRDRETAQERQITTTSYQSIRTTDTSIRDLEILDDETEPSLNSATTSLHLMRTIEANETITASIRQPSHGDEKRDIDVQRIIRANLSHLGRRQGSTTQREDEEDQEHQQNQAHQENLRQAMATSEAEAQRYAREAFEYEQQLNRVLAQSLTEERQTDVNLDYNSNMSLDNETNEQLHQSPAYDSGHLAGTIQNEFDAQQQKQHGEKKALEKTEEDIILMYIKKQSLLEQNYQKKGKGRATAMEEQDDEDLQKALDISLQGYEHNARHAFGEKSGT